MGVKLAIALTVAGAAAIAAGVALVYLPAGVITAGLEAVAAGLFGIDVKPSMKSRSR